LGANENAIEEIERILYGNTLMTGVVAHRGYVIEGLHFCSFGCFFCKITSATLTD